MVDLTDGGILVEQRLLAAPDLRDVSHQQQGPDAPVVTAQGDGADRQEHSADLDLGQPGLTAHEHDRHRLVHGRALGDDRGDRLGEHLPVDLAGQPQAVEARARIR